MERKPNVHILLLTLVFSPDGVSTAELMTELALELRKLGYELTVLTTTPHYNLEPEARQRQPLVKRWGSLLYQSDFQAIPVYHASIPVKGKRVGARLLDYMRFHMISTLAGLASLSGKYDLILAPSPPLTIGLSAWILSNLRHVPFIYNVQEIYPDVAVNLGVLRNRYLIRAMEWLELFVYAKAQCVVVISEWFRRRLLEKGVQDIKLQVIPNFVNTKFLRPGERQNPFSAQYNLGDRFVVLYAGNIGLTQGFETILMAAHQLETSDPQICFVIIGDGARRDWLESQLSERNCANIILLPYQSKSSVPQIYATSDVCLVPLKRGTSQETFPSKIYSIMAAGRPVIVSSEANSELAWVVEHAECGWAVPPDDPDALASAIKNAYQRRSELQNMGLLGREYVIAHHSPQAVAQQYDRLIQTIVNPG